MGSFLRPGIYFTPTVVYVPAYLSVLILLLKSFLKVIFVSYFQVYPSFSGIPCFMEGLTRFSAVRVVVIHGCHLPSSFHFQMRNTAIRLPTPLGLLQLAVPTRIQFLLSDHLSSLPVKLSGCIFASLVKGLSFTSHVTSAACYQAICKLVGINLVAQ